LKNLFRLKDGLGPCLVDTTPHNIYLFMASLYRKYAIYIVESEPIKASEGEGVCLSQLQNIAEAISPVKYKEEEQEAYPSIRE
jgi:hypothetical protein